VESPQGKSGMSLFVMARPSDASSGNYVIDIGSSVSAGYGIASSGSQYNVLLTAFKKMDLRAVEASNCPFRVAYP
jgi:hypothetical protein